MVAGKAHIGVYHHAVLNVGSGANRDRLVIAAQYGFEPNTDILANNNASTTAASGAIQYWPSEGSSGDILPSAKSGIVIASLFHTT